MRILQLPAPFAVGMTLAVLALVGCSNSTPRATTDESIAMHEENHVADPSLRSNSSIDVTAREIRLRRQAALDEFEALLQSAKDEAAKHQYNAATASVLSAKLRIRDNARFMPASLAEERLARADELLGQIEAERELYAQLHRE